MSRLTIMSALALLGILFGIAGAEGPAGGQSSFGVIKGPSFDQARTQSLQWLKESNVDAATLQRAEAVWDAAVERPMLDRVAETLLLGDAEAQRIINYGRNAATAAPTGVPELLKDGKRPPFVRANLGLYYAKHLTNRRVHDEALEVLRGIKPEQVVDPASYYFFKAVAENRLVQKEEGLQSIHRLLNSVADVPERYTTVARLMQSEMERWKDKDLGYVARRMEEIEGRLGLARGGPKTQEKQKEVIDLLTKQIEELEKQCGA